MSHVCKQFARNAGASPILGIAICDIKEPLNFGECLLESLAFKSDAFSARIRAQCLVFEAIRAREHLLKEVSAIFFQKPKIFLTEQATQSGRPCESPLQGKRTFCEISRFESQSFVGSRSHAMRDVHIHDKRAHFCMNKSNANRALLLDSV